MSVRACLTLLAFAAPAGASSYQVLYKFGTGPTDLGGPQSSLVADSAGRIYGTSPTGGQYGGGGVFQLTPPASPALPWSFAVLHQFTPGSVSYPSGALTMGPSGELYGATAVSAGTLGGGAIYRLDNTAGWPLAVLHSFPFTDPADGALPAAPPVFGPDGLLYGTTSVDPYRGTVFSLSPQGDTTAFSTLYAFGRPPDAATPSFGVVSAPSGALYGVSASGGANGTGAFFVLNHQGAPAHEQILYSFKPFGSGDAYQPLGAVAMGVGIYSGSLFGCSHGGANGAGALYRLIPPASGSTTWTESLLYSFIASSTDPQPEYSSCALSISSAGQIYGVTAAGGSEYGALFAFNPPAAPGAPWTVTTLHTFKAPNGTAPNAPPLLLGGNIYGTTPSGAGTERAAYHTGIIWQYIP